MKHDNLLELQSGFKTAYIDGSHASNLAFKPQFVSNNYKEGSFVRAMRGAWTILFS